MFQPKMIDLFFKYVPVYHKGSEVHLAEGLQNSKYFELLFSF